MAIIQPIGTDKQNSPDHSLLHRQIASDDTAPVKSIVVDSAGSVGIGTETPGYLLDVPGQIGTQEIQFDTSFIPTLHPEGLLHWNATIGTLEVAMPGGEVNLQIGFESLIKVTNDSGVDIKNGNLVYTTGAAGDLLTVALADASDSDKLHVLGMATEDIDNAASGYVCTRGRVTGTALQPINTSGSSLGDKLYLSTAGGWTTTHPSNPTYGIVVFGHVSNVNSTTGSIVLNNVSSFSIGNNFDGILRQSVINKNTGTSAMSSFTVVNDQGYRGSLNIIGSNHALFPGNSVVLYNQGYEDTGFMNDGNVDFRWFSDPTDQHDYTSYSNEIMRLTAAGKLGIGTATPSAYADLTLEGGPIALKETTTPTADSGYGKIYTKTDNVLYFQDGAGVEHSINESSYGEMKIGDNTTATVIRGANQWQGVTSNMATGLVSGFTYDAGLLGAIASTSGTGTVATINDVAHGLTAGDIISINGTTSYNGIYEVNTVPGPDSFTILHSASTNETGYWQKPSSLTADTGTSGTFRGSWDSCGIAVTNGHVFDFAPYVNTTRSTQATARRSFSNADYGSFSGTGLTEITAGDTLSFFIRNTSATGNLTIRAFDFNVVKI